MKIPEIPLSCPACGGRVEWSATRKARVCAYCATTAADESASMHPSPAAPTALPPSPPASFAQSPLGKLAGRFAAQQQNPGSFVRGLRDLSDDAQKAGVFSTLGTIAKIIRWLGMLVFATLAVFCVIGAVKGRQAGILYVPAGVFALLAWGFFWLGSKSSR